MSKRVELEDGTILNLIKEIGKGAYSVVYSCTVLKSISFSTPEHVYACKKIPLFQDTDRCLLEAAIMSTISHPNLTHSKYIGFGKNSNDLFIIQERAITDLHEVGCPLGQNPTQKDVDKLKSWMYNLVLGTRCLHREAIVHGDIKPANALLYANGTVALTDFSLAYKHWGPGEKDDGRRRTIISTVTHRAPEVHLASKKENQPWNEAADIWSLGCTMYEIAHGKRIFEYHGIDDDVLNDINVWVADPNNPWKSVNTSPNNLSYKYKKIEIQCLSKKFPKLKFMNEMDDLISRCLHFDPSKRITAQEALRHPLFSGMISPKYSFCRMNARQIDSNTINHMRIAMTEAAGPPALILFDACLKNTKYHQQSREIDFDENDIKIEISPRTETIFRSAFDIACMASPLFNKYDAVRICQASWRLAQRMCLAPLSPTHHNVLEAERAICSLLSFRLFVGVDSSSPIA